MESFVFAFFGLLIYTILRDIYLLKTIGDLTNKLMSRNYGEYMQSNALVNQQDKVQVQLPTEPVEDFGQLNEFIQ